MRVLTSEYANVMTDMHGRKVRYLRLSVTDRCNLRCAYCRSHDDWQSISHSDVLRYEEMLIIAKAAVDIGVEKIRITGGEPFARKGVVSFMEMLRKNHPHVDVHITTNATLVHPHVRALKDIGVRAVNISLDSFVPTTFARISGQDALHKVREAIDALMDAGIRIKLNAVAMRGITDVEMEHFVAFAMKYPVDVRFIEFMPMGSGTVWDPAVFLPAADILHAAERYAKLSPYVESSEQVVKEAALSGPATMYSLAGGAGRVGVITAISNHFCNICNRIRITCDGFVRTCLFADTEYTIRDIVRNPALNTEQMQHSIQKVMIDAIQEKPLGEALLKARQTVAVAKKKMVSIGG